MKIRTLVTGLVLAGLVAPIGRSQPPPWWTTRQVIDVSKTPADYAAANQGQAKAIAAKAYEEFEARLPGGAGATLGQMIASWSTPTNARDYAGLNVGQLKALAKPFYDRLAAVGYQGQPLSAGQTYPWTTITTDDKDYALANIGQLKTIFSFNLAVTPTDTDGDGLPDAWEIARFGSITAQNGNGDPDGDGLTNLQEYNIGSNPNVADTDGDGMNDGQEYYSGRNPTDFSDSRPMPVEYVAIIKVQGDQYYGVKSNGTLQGVGL